jgi:hypothetical protein
MKVDDAIKYIVEKALAQGYDEAQLRTVIPDLREMLYQLPTTDQDDVDLLCEELF